MDHYAAMWAPLMVGLLSCIVLAWVYKMDNFATNVRSMLGHEPRWWWRSMWKFVTPLVLTVGSVCSIILYMYLHQNLPFVSSC